MVIENYVFRRANSLEDSKKLYKFFNEVFYPEDVGTLAKTMFEQANIGVTQSVVASCCFRIQAPRCRQDSKY